MLCIHYEKSGARSCVKAGPPTGGHFPLGMWISILSWTQIEAGKSFFFDKWNFETNNPTDRHWFEIFERELNCRKNMVKVVKEIATKMCGT